MMSSNKILTVSYGTFSCTLEGFEDSFGTMKAIAEYFRDLAAEDRYFGAEPPKPDAEMLARIAENEIERRVEARASETGIHLRADEVAPVAAAAIEAPVAAPEEPEAEPEFVPEEPAALADTTEEVHPAALAQTPSMDEEDASDADQSIAAVLQQDASQDIPQTPVEDDDFEENIADAQTTAIDEPAQQSDAQHDAEPAPDETDIPSMKASMGFGVFAAAATESVTPVEPNVAPEIVAEDVPVAPAQAEPNSIAAKLQRIRAVVAKTQDTSAQNEDLNEPADDQGGSDLVEDFFSSAVADQFEPLGAQEDGPEMVEEDIVEDEDFGIVLAEAEDEVEDDTPQLSEPEVLPQDRTEDSVLDLGSFEAEPELEIDAETDEIDEIDEISNLLAEQNETEDEAEDDYEDIESAVSNFLEDDVSIPEIAEDEVPEPPRAQIIKVMRSDIDAAIESGLLEEADDEEFADLSLDAPDTDSTLSEDDEAELLRELAAVEAEFEDVPEPDTAEADQATADATAARLLEEVAGADEDELDRLMAEADHQMEEPESTSRRSAFQHLRGAVEATKADEKLSDAAKLADEDEYRTDLAAAVRPRRPVAGTGEGRKGRPRNERPAPLKLVAEQRIDTASLKTGPVSPRRVARDVHIDDDGNFADYASARGASELPDLLEAAASYLSFVEGREQFSRPQLMTKVRQLKLEGFTREDGLRHFGKLLRSGKIEKIKGGRFTVSDEIGFQPDDQRAAG